MTTPKSTPMITHIIHRLAVGGLENGLVNLINRIPPERYRHTIISLTDATDFQKRIRVPVSLYCLHKREGKDPGLYWRLWRLLRRLQPDLVHTRNLATLEGQVCAFAAGVQVRVHGEHGWDVSDLTGANAKYRALRKLIRPLVGRYIPLSQHQASYLREEIRVPEDRISLICNGVDTVRFAPAAEKKAAREQLMGAPAGFFAPDALVIGTVGRMEPVKDQFTLARAFIRCVEQTGIEGQRLRLLLVGGGSLKSGVAQLLQESGVWKQVWMAGTREDIPELLRALDLFVLPSLAEGISNTVLEAMASGLPVLATDVGGNRELVCEGETGTLVPASDVETMAQRLLDYTSDPTRLLAEGRAARQRVQACFSIDQMVANYLRVYDQLLSERVPSIQGDYTANAPK